MKIKKERLRQIIRDVIEEVVGNWAHDSDGRFSSEKDATSMSRSDIGQFAYPSKVNRKPCGSQNRARTCKKDEGKILPTKNEDMDRQTAIYLRAIVGKEIRKAIADATKNNDCSFSDLVRAMTIWKKAETAKATSPK